MKNNEQRKVKIKYVPLIKYVLIVFVILTIIDPSLFFDMSVEPAPAFKSKYRFVLRDRNDQPIWLIANYGQVKFTIPLQKKHISISGSRGEEFFEVFASWPGFNAPLEELEPKGKSLQNDDVLGRVRLGISYKVNEHLPQLKRLDLRYKGLSPPGKFYKPIKPYLSDKHYFKYNNQEISVGCNFNTDLPQDEPTDNPGWCELYVVYDRDVSIHVSIPRELMFYQAVIEDVFKLLDHITIQPEEQSDNDLYQTLINQYTYNLSLPTEEQE